MKISFCTVSMNRLHHLKQTLPQNIIDNLTPVHGAQVEFIILDYNSNDGLESWAKTNLKLWVESGVVKYYKTIDPIYFNRSHSRNMAFKLATGDILCNIDADNYIGNKFSDYVFNFFHKNINSFLTPAFNTRDSIGKVCLKKDDFILQRGFNESMSGYGFEDFELYARLVSSKIKHQIIYNPEFLNTISHSHEERYENEFLSKNLHSIYVHHENPWKSVLIFLYKDFSFDTGTIINNEILRIKDMNNPSLMKVSNSSSYFSEFFEENSAIRLLEEWENGFWEFNNNTCVLHSKVGKAKRSLIVVNNNILNDNKRGKIFKKILNHELSKALILLKTELANRLIFNSTYNSPQKQINALGYGVGSVFKNFENTSTYQIS